MPLIEDLTQGPVPAGSMLLVEFSEASQWYNAALTIAAGWLKDGGRLGVNCEENERSDNLRIWDWYTATLGKKSDEKYAYDSLKAADLSLRVAKEDMRESPQPEWLRMIENASTWYRFNDEKAAMELELTRFIPSLRLRKSTTIRAMLKDTHSNWLCQQLEGVHDGIIDLKLDETADPAQNMLRIRSMRNVGFDGRWHRLKIKENFEVILEK